MKKPTRVFACSECGDQFSRWAGKCPSCGNWNTIQEESVTEKFSPAAKKQRLSYAKPLLLSEVREDYFQRILTGISELDHVLGGGIVRGSLTLIGGEPGVGKSTLILEIARHFKGRILYISGEESAAQIALRAKRMTLDSSNLLISSESSADRIADMIEEEKPEITFIDSIQTVTREALPGQAGTVSQLRECTQIFLETSKRTGCPIFLVGHITKEGSIAGPKILEHLVDTVLYFEGDKLNYYRLLRAVKNRFGPVGDLAVFEMHKEGLREVKDENIFLSTDREERTGSVISAVMEGSRSIAVEVQALVARTSYSQARRMAEGLDNRRLILIAAVIEKYLGLKMSESDVFSNLAGGLSADEPALDLAITASIISSYYNKPFSGSAFFGEVGLSGEIRPVVQSELRIRVLQSAGIKKLFLPSGNADEFRLKTTMEIRGLSHVRELEKFFSQ